MGAKKHPADKLLKKATGGVVNEAQLGQLGW